MGRNTFYEAVDAILGNRRDHRTQSGVWDGFAFTEAGEKYLKEYLVEL